VKGEDEKLSFLITMNGSEKGGHQSLKWDLPTQVPIGLDNAGGTGVQ